MYGCMVTGNVANGSSLADGGRGRDCGSEADDDLLLCSVSSHTAAPTLFTDFPLPRFTGGSFDSDGFQATS
jgi:hypothetical protein